MITRCGSYNTVLYDIVFNLEIRSDRECRVRTRVFRMKTTKHCENNLTERNEIRPLI